MNSWIPKLHVALPALDELEYISEFIDCIKIQNFKNFELWICVNQPDEWWNEKDKIQICQNNQSTIEYLNSIKDLPINIIDKSSKGNGWVEKKRGVGWARKTLMDEIVKTASNSDIILSLDADTSFNSNYFESILKNFNKNPEAVGLSVPYTHKLSGDSINDRAILRYEIYMRYFAINMWRIGSPYSFTAIGSAIALPVKSYKTIGGITPHKSGEDFYLLQKLQKYGRVLKWNNEKVFPSARYSDRVGFGTGPALIKGKNGDWQSYPIYPFELFDHIKVLYDLFPKLYNKSTETPIDNFIFEKFGEKDIWSSLRKNYKNQDQFVRACHNKIDGFRIFQYLKWKHQNNNSKDEKNLIEWLNKYYIAEVSQLKINLERISFSNSTVKELNILRNLLAGIEEKHQIDNWNKLVLK